MWGKKIHHRNFQENVYNSCFRVILPSCLNNLILKRQHSVRKIYTAEKIENYRPTYFRQHIWKSKAQYVICKASIIYLTKPTLCSSLDCRKQVDVVYTDFSKVFEKIDHSILLKKLNNCSHSLISILTLIIGNSALLIMVNAFSYIFPNFFYETGSFNK